MKKLFLLFAAVFLAFFAAPCLAEVSAVPALVSDSDIKVPEDTPLRPLERKGEWLKVRTSQNGKSVERWVNEQQVTPSPNDLIECQARIVKGWKK